MDASCKEMGMRNFNILPLVPHASGRPRNSLIFLTSSRALAATDILGYLTVFNNFPQKSLRPWTAARAIRTAQIRRDALLSSHHITQRNTRWPGRFRGSRGSRRRQSGTSSCLATGEPVPDSDASLPIWNNSFLRYLPENGGKSSS